MTVFTLDYAARAISASTTNGLMRYLWSFYGIVDLLSVLPFFVGLSSFGGLESLSPALFPTLVSCPVSLEGGLGHELFLIWRGSLIGAMFLLYQFPHTFFVYFILILICYGSQREIDVIFAC